MTDQKLLKARIQQEIANKVSTKMLEELRLKDYQLRVIKTTLIKNKIEKIIYNNNLAAAQTTDKHFREMCLYSNNQLNQIIHLVDAIIGE